ncbi:MAG: glycosyltransferase family 4 protein, partial [Thermoleophilaceae bacterium]
MEALADEFLARGHDVRLMAPYDPDDRHARLTHGGVRPQRRELPDHVIPLGRTIGVPANGAVSNLSVTSQGLPALSRELRFGGYDVVHVHEPNAPVVSWVAAEWARSPLVGTFHAYSTRWFPNTLATLIGARRLYNKIHVRIAVSDAARWTAQRWYGGRYRIVPNGVDLRAAMTSPKPEGDELRLLFLGRAEERKGLPVLLRAFEALRGADVHARLTIAGAGREEVEPYLMDEDGIEILGGVSEEEKWRLLHDADVLCAPSLGGESFGMVLTEAFAAATPVVASGIPGYQDVVSHGVDGLLFPRGDATALAETLRDLALDPARRAQMGRAAAEHAQRYAWPRIAAEVTEVYEAAVAVPAPTGAARRAAVRIGALPADLQPRVPARRLPTMEPAPTGTRGQRGRAVARRVGLAAAGLGAAGLALLGLQRIGFDRIG